MPTIVIASKNPVKIQAALNGFQRIFPQKDVKAVSLSVPSGVRDQPRSEEETLRGAKNRAQEAAERLPEADFWVGIEGGVTEIDGEMAAFAWIVVRSENLVGRGRTGTFFLPQQVASLIRAGKELGEADDIVFNRENSKQNEGAIGILTENVLDRTRYYEHAMILALVPFKNQSLYHRQET